MSSIRTTHSIRSISAAFFPALVLFIALDLVWVGFIAQDFYDAQIGPLLRELVRWDAVGLFYLLYAAGVVTFCVMPVASDQSWRQSSWRGAVLGAIAYGTYNLTNLATLNGWTYTMAIVDISWGIFATSVLASASFLSKRLIGKTS